MLFQDYAGLSKALCLNLSQDSSVNDHQNLIVEYLLSQLEIGNLERTRSIMAEELVKLTNQNDDLEEKVKEIPKLRVQLRVGEFYLL